MPSIDGLYRHIKHKMEQIRMPIDKAREDNKEEARWNRPIQLTDSQNSKLQKHVMLA